MTKERKKLISYLTAVIILFGGGVGLGYYIWGLDKQKKPDYKNRLTLRNKRLKPLAHLLIYFINGFKF